MIACVLKERRILGSPHLRIASDTLFLQNNAGFVRFPGLHPGLVCIAPLEHFSALPSTVRRSLPFPVLLQRGTKNDERGTKNYPDSDSDESHHPPPVLTPVRYAPLSR